MKAKATVLKSRWVSVILLTLCLLLAAGCSLGTKGNGTATPEAQGPTKEPAATEKRLEAVKLVWYLRQEEPNNAASVLAKFNELVSAKINATVEFKFINPGDYDSKMQLVMASGEEYDLVFTSSWANNYANNVSKGAYLALDEWLEQFPAIKDLQKPEIWNAVKAGGVTYGIPNKQIMANQGGIWLLKEYVDKYSLDTASVKSLEDLTGILQTIRDNEPDLYPIRNGVPLSFLPYYPSVEGFRIDVNTLKVLDLSEEFLRRYKISREWNTKGFFPSDVATMKNETELIKAGKIFSRYARQLPGVEATLKTSYGHDFVMLSANSPVVNQSAVQSTITAISATSKNPERALMLYELLLTDKEIFNTLVFGLEGQDYVKVADNRIEPAPESYSVQNWMVGNAFNSYLVPGQADDVWEETERLNNSAVVDPLISFSFDRTPVQNELARLSAVDKEMLPILENGLDDPVKTYQAYREKQEAAGRANVVAEIERQLQEWSKQQ